MDIEFVGNTDGNNRVVFEKLLAKWDDLFTRKTIFDGMELVETGDVEIVTMFSNGDTKLTFWQMESYKYDIEYLEKKVAESLKSLAAMKFAIDDFDNNVKIITEILYEVDAKKRILFVCKENTYSDNVILHTEFSDDSGDMGLHARVIADDEGENTEITLNVLLKALDKEEIYVHFENFKSQITEYKKKLQLEKLKPSFDALDTL